MDRPVASVIIPTKNAGKLFIRVLDSVLSQQAPWAFDVWVIDSGSSDGTVEWVNQKISEHVHLNLIQIPPFEFGHGKTRNLGARLSRGSFIVFLTHDALPANQEWLKNLVSACGREENIAGAFGRHLPYPECDPIIAHEIKKHFDSLFAKPLVRMEDKARYDSDEGYRQALHFFSDNNSCLRRAVWEKIPFPEVNFAEDQAWAKLIIEAGYSKAYVDDARVFHSHSYSAVQSFRRAFDESLALRKLFGYRQQKSFLKVPPKALVKSFRDLRYLTANGLLSFKLGVHVFLVNFMKLAGSYLGANDFLPMGIARKISLDQSLKEGRS